MATAEIILPLLGGIRDATNPPGVLWTADVEPYLTLDGTTDELITWSFRMFDNYASGLSVKSIYSMASATTNNVAVRSEIKAVSMAEDAMTAAFDTLNKSADSTVPGTADLLKEISYALTNVDSLAAGDKFTFKFGRENATTGTNATGDMYVWAISLLYTTT